VQDGVVPRTKLPLVLRQIDALSQEHGLRVGNVFHAGDGNLHPLVLYDGRVDGEAERAERLAARILELCVEAGGSITGEHGVGADKACAMPLMFGEDDLAVMARLRGAFDPNGLANPGKIFPTPRLCGEVPGPYRAHPLEKAGLAQRL
jgi:glycolate oxidase